MRLPSQVVQDELTPSFDRVDGSLEAALDAEAAFSFDLEQGPVLRALVVDSGGDRTLVLTAPSVVADATSLAIAARECAGASADGDEPLQYADYAEWRYELAAGDDDGARQGRAYWEQTQAEGVSPVLLFGRLAEGASSQAKNRVAFDVPAEIASVADPVVFMEAAWHVLVARLANESEVSLGSVREGRAAVELAGAIGSFTVPVALTTRLREDTSFVEVVDQVKRAGEDAASWLDYAPAAAAAAVLRSCSTSFAPVAGIDGVDSIRAAEWPFALQLEVRPDGGAWSAQLAYDAKVYSERDAASIGRSYTTLLSAAIGEPSRRVAAMPLLGETERQEILDGFNRTEKPFQPEPIHHLFEAQAERVPDRPAVVGGGVTYTYRELDERAGRIAAFLRDRGIERNVPVGLCMDRTADMIASLLGILKAGGAYVPLNSEHPPARLAHQLSESGAPLVLVQAAHVERLSEFKGDVVAVDTDDIEASVAAHSADIVRASEPDDLAYVMYTSGSTGLPKGVEVTHTNLANYTSHLIEKVGALEGDGFAFALVTAISTDLGNTSVFPALCSGGTLHLVSPQAAMDGSLYASYVEEHPIDVLKITPSHLSGLLNGAEIESILPQRLLVTGGEALPWALAEQVQSAGRCRMLNHYGPTETTIGSCTFDVGDDVSAWRPGTVPVGKPISNTRAYVLDRQLEAVPVGVPGELCIAGAGVARGYIEQPEQTSAVFVPDPAGSGPLYRTGDLARFLPDGNIEFLGRRDEQVKIRGFRVEPAEVEAVLGRHPDVNQAAVAVATDAHGSPRLVAYVVAAKQPDAADLRAFCADSVPDFMVPSQFVAIDALPFTASGKIDRRALPDPGELELAQESEYVAPSTPLEEDLAAIWADVLGVERVGATDDFFALGGHSLLATQIVARVRTTLNVDLPLHILFLSPTVEGLAREIIGLQANGGAGDAEMEALLDELEGLQEEDQPV
jgi:amino acid adenylation domain-containing protein